MECSLIKWIATPNAEQSILLLLDNVCLLSGSIRINDLIIYKTLLKITVKDPSFLSHVILSVLFNKTENKALC